MFELEEENKALRSQLLRTEIALEKEKEMMHQKITQLEEKIRDSNKNEIFYRNSHSNLTKLIDNLNPIKSRSRPRLHSKMQGFDSKRRSPVVVIRSKSNTRSRSLITKSLSFLKDTYSSLVKTPVNKYRISERYTRLSKHSIMPRSCSNYSKRSLKEFEMSFSKVKNRCIAEKRSNQIKYNDSQPKTKASKVGINMIKIDIQNKRILLDLGPIKKKKRKGWSTVRECNSPLRATHSIKLN